MSSDETMTPSAEDLDLDEDLFDFDEISGGGSLAEEDDADLDEIFATFQNQDDDDTTSGPEPSESEAPDTVDFSVPSAAPPPPGAMPEGTAGGPTPTAIAGVPVQFAPTPGTMSVGMPRPIIWIFVILTCVNVLLAIVMLNIAGSMSSGVKEMTTEVSNTVGQFATRATNELEAHRQDELPVLAPDPANHEAFDTASTMIEEGRYAEARRILYALLAVVDRMDPVERQGVEARANYLIAHAFQREAHNRIGGRR